VILRLFNGARARQGVRRRLTPGLPPAPHDSEMEDENDEQGRDRPAGSAETPGAQEGAPTPEGTAQHSAAESPPAQHSAAESPPAQESATEPAAAQPAAAPGGPPRRFGKARDLSRRKPAQLLAAGLAGAIIGGAAVATIGALTGDDRPEQRVARFGPGPHRDGPGPYWWGPRDRGQPPDQGPGWGYPGGPRARRVPPPGWVPGQRPSPAPKPSTPATPSATPTS
jgi:hypothetical protein